MNNITPVDEEYIFEGRAIIGQTDLEGVITFINRQFCNISGYKAEELIGKPYNIIRHPDMPRATFEQMWKTIKSGQAWNGLIKNLRKDGLYYWVETEILPIKNEDDKITGFITTGKSASRTNIQETAELYKKMLETEES
jgi:aerotaxis receptor